VTNRREFLQTAAALSAAPLAGRAAFANAHRAPTLDAVVLDSRHTPARDFGARASLLGARAWPIAGDITELWQTELLERWRERPGAIAGLTERPALFLLERLAWDHGLRVVFVAEHEPRAHGTARHRVVRTAAPDLALELDAAGESWPSALADALIAAGAVAAADGRPTDSGLAARLDEPTKLYSWIIAPRSAIRREI